LTFRRGVEFRSGSSRELTDRYRDRTKPAMYRNTPLVYPFVSGLFLALLVLGAAAFVLGWPGETPSRADALILVALFGLSLVFLGYTPILMYRPPRWLVPNWLAAEDVEIGWIPPEPDWFDRFVVGAGVLTIGVGFLSVV